MTSKQINILSSFILSSIQTILTKLQNGEIEEHGQVDTKLIHDINHAYETLALFEPDFTDKEKYAMELANIFFSNFLKSYSFGEDKDECCVCFTETEFVSICCRKHLCRDCLKSLKTNQCPNCRHSMGDIDYDII